MDTRTPMTDTTLTDTEQSQVNASLDYMRRNPGAKDDLLVTVERIVAARVADRDTWWRERIEAITATPDDEQWWPVRPYDDVDRDDEVVQVAVINADRLRALAAEARTQGGASCAK